MAYALTKAGMRVLALRPAAAQGEEYRLDELTESVFQRARLGPKFNTGCRPGGARKAK
jgi:hypothetical protein